MAGRHAASQMASASMNMKAVFAEIDADERHGFHDDLLQK